MTNKNTNCLLLGATSTFFKCMKQMLHMLITGGPRKVPPNLRGGDLAWAWASVNIEHECTFANIGEMGLELEREEFMSCLLTEFVREQRRQDL